MMLSKIISISLIIFVFLFQISFGQEAVKRISPLAITTVKYKDAYIKVVYGQPARKKREIFGKLVPYDQVWRTGANEATEITFTRDVNIQGKSIPTGTYSLFTIPGANQWTIILNKEVGLWGAYNYNSKSDLERWTVPVQKFGDKSVEWFTILLDSKNNIADLVLSWDNVSVTLPIQFNEPKQ